MHLQVAEQITIHKRLSGEARELTRKHYPAFYFGNVAPDYQWLCDIPREETHFYGLPPRPGERAYPTMLARYPSLARPSELPGAQAIFVAAYCAHLMLDLRWYREVLIPYFVETQNWDSHRQRFVVHNTLLTYLDKLAVGSLPKVAGSILSAASPNRWLPFAVDSDLARWRDMLVSQLQPGAPLQTIRIYAERLLMSPSEFSANLEEPSWMEENLFSKVPVDEVQSMMKSAVAQSSDLISEYLRAE